MSLYTAPDHRRLAAEAGLYPAADLQSAFWRWPPPHGHRSLLSRVPNGPKGSRSRSSLRASSERAIGRVTSCAAGSAPSLAAAGLRAVTQDMEAGQARK